MKTCCFTGHRIQKAGFEFSEYNFKYISLKNQVTQHIKSAIEDGFANFISGMAIGFDMLCAEVVLELKKHYNINLILALPCHNQEKYFKEKEKIKYRNILKSADKVIYVSEEYYNGCMQKRDRYMVDNSSLIIAFYLGIAGGTKTTLNYALNKGLKIQIINSI